MPKRTYITQWHAKQLQSAIKQQTLSVIAARDGLEGCFHFIRDVIPILRERAEMGCICECPSPCRCGKDAAIGLLRRLYELP